MAIYDYKKIARSINKRFQERETRLKTRPDSKFAHGFSWASDLNKCLLILEDLKKKVDLDRYQNWFRKEIESIAPHVKYIDKHLKWIRAGHEFLRSKTEPIGSDFNDLDFDDLRFDEYGLRLCLFSATIAYCAQFGLENFQIFCDIYKELLNLSKLNTLTSLPG